MEKPPLNPPSTDEILDDSKESFSFLKSTSPEFRESLTDVFLEPMTIDESWHFTDHPLSPTFGDPTIKSSESGITFKEAATTYLEALVDKKASWLDEDIKNVVLDEVKSAHDKRCDQNELSLNRMLFAAQIEGPEVFTDAIQNQILNERCGQATTLDRVNLLARYPVALALEDIKNTGCLLDVKMHGIICEMYATQLSALEDENVKVTILDKATNITTVDTTQAQQKGILIIKRKVAQLGYNGVNLDAILRTSYVVLPPDLKNIPDGYVRNVKTINGHALDLQPAFLSGYIHFSGFDNWAFGAEDTPEES